MSKNIGHFDREGLPCVKCGFTVHERYATFCQSCGTKLEGNYCSNLECARCIDRDFEKKDESILEKDNGIIFACAGNALYCPDCGSKTNLHLRGVLKPRDL